MQANYFAEKLISAMKTYKSFIEFTSDYRTSDRCREHLCEVKWGNGYKCGKCDHDVSVKGRKWYYRKCQRCHYDESCTAHTLFHKLKFPLMSAFWIVYQLSTMKKGMSTLEISRQYDVCQETAWYFKSKVQLAMQQSQDLLNDSVEVDETAIGGYDEGSPGRSHGDKKIVQVALEVDYPGDDDRTKPTIKRGAARIVSDYSAKELGKAIDTMIHPEAMISTDLWPSYPKAVGERWHLTYPSDSGEGFPDLHWHIFNLKNWVRGIHHHISAKHAQKYLDEFHFRFNRRNFLKACPKFIILCMVNHPAITYSQVIGT